MRDGGCSRMRKGCFTVGRGERNYSNKGKKAEVWDLSGFEIPSCPYSL